MLNTIAFLAPWYYDASISAQGVLACSSGPVAQSCMIMLAYVHVLSACRIADSTSLLSAVQDSLSSAVGAVPERFSKCDVQLMWFTAVNFQSAKERS